MKEICWAKHNYLKYTWNRTEQLEAYHGGGSVQTKVGFLWLERWIRLLNSALLQLPNVQSFQRKMNGWRSVQNFEGTKNLLRILLILEGLSSFFQKTCRNIFRNQIKKSNLVSHKKNQKNFEKNMESKLYHHLNCQWHVYGKIR